jgi:hypothetical protein
MAQVNIITRERATYVGLESAYGTTPSGSFPNAMTRIFAIGDDEARDPQEEMLDNLDERVLRNDAIHPIHGLQLASSFAFKCYLKTTPNAVQLEDGATAGSIPERIILTHALGTEHADEGSTAVNAGSSTTAVVVQSGHGTRFKKGTFIAVQISGAMEWTKVTNIATDTLTVSPALSGTPADSAIVRNLYNYAAAETHANSLTIRQANVGSSAAQYTFNGCYGNFALELPEFGQLPMMTLQITATSVVGPSAQGIGTDTATDIMGAPIVFRPEVYIASGGTITRGTRTVVEGLGVEYSNQWEQVRDGSTSSTVAAVVDTGGRPRAVKFTCRTRFDVDWETAFNADTAYNIVMVQRIGTGTTAAFWIISLPNAKLVAKPKPSKVGERMYLDLEFSGLRDTQPTLGNPTPETGTDLDLLGSPFKVAFG